MGASGIEAGKAVVRISEEGAAAVASKLQNLSKTFAHIGESVSAFGEKLSKIGGIAMAPLLASAKLYGTMGDELQNMSDRTGIAASSLSVLSYAAKMSGADIDDVEKAVKKMQRGLAEAETKGTSDMFDELGISVAKFKQLDPSQQLIAVGSAISKIAEPAQRTAAQIEWFGKSGTKLAGLFKDGSAGVDEMRAKMEKLGLVMSNEAVAAADDFDDVMTSCWESIKMVSFHIGSSLAPVIIPLATSFQQTAKGVGDWIKANTDSIITIAKVSAGLIVVGAGLLAFGKTISVVSSLLAGLATAFRVVAAASALMVANPVVAALAALAVVSGLVIYAMHRASTVSLEFNDASRDAIETHDKERSAIQGKMDTLQELADQQSLTSEETKTAKTLIEAITKSYGDLGIKIDSATGKIVGMGGAWEQMTEKMKAERLAEMDKRINELGDRVIWLVQVADETPWYDKMFGDSVKQNAEIDKTVKQMNDLKEEADKLRGAKTVSDVTGKQSATNVKGANPNKAANDDVDKDIASNMRDLKKLKIEGMENEHDKSIALINHEYDYKVKKAKESKAEAWKVSIDVMAIEGQRILAIANEEKKQQAKIKAEKEKNAEEIAKLQIQATTEGYAQTIKLLEEERNQRLHNAQKTGEDTVQIEKEFQLKKQIAAKSVDEYSKNITEGNAGLAIDANTAMTPLQKTLAKLRLERGKALEDAKKAGLEDMSGVNKQFDLKEDIARQAAKSNTVSSQGTFSVSGARNLGTQRSEMYLAEIAKNTKKAAGHGPIAAP